MFFKQLMDSFIFKVLINKKQIATLGSPIINSLDCFYGWIINPIEWGSGIQ